MLLLGLLAVYALRLVLGQDLAVKSVLTNNYVCRDASEVQLGQIGFDNSGASSVISSVSCGGDSKYLIWYKWTATYTGFLQASTCDSVDFPNVIAVFKGTCPNNFYNAYACNTQGCGSEETIYTAIVNFPVEQDTTYYILIAGNNSPYYGTGTLKLSDSTLSFTLLNSSVTSQGGPVDFIASYDAYDSTQIKLDLICDDGTIPYSGFFDTSPNVQTFPFPVVTANQLCNVRIYYPTYLEFEVTADIPVYGNLVINNPQEGDTIYTNTPFQLLVKNDESPIAQDPLNVYFTCSDGEQILQAVSGIADNNAMITAPISGVCEIFAITAPVESDQQYYETFSNTTVTIIQATVTTTEMTTTEATSTESDGTTTEAITTEATTTDVTSTEASITEATSTEVTTSTATVTTYTLSLSASPAAPTAGSSVSYAVYFTPPLVESVQLRLTCNSQEVQSVSTSTTLTPTTQSFEIDAAAIGDCTLRAIPANPDYPLSDPVSLTVYQQLYVASSLQGWIGGSPVTVNVTSPNLSSFPINLITTCSTDSQSQQISTSSSASYSLKSTLNGINCLLSTTSIPQFYLPIPPTPVNVALSPALQQQLIQQLNPAAFRGALNGPGA